MGKKYILGLFCLLLSLGMWAAPYTVVIDPGHGGKDAGAVGRNGLLEKDLNLDVSLRLASKIRSQFPETKVLLTRTSDEFISLQNRADFVNKNSANLFICIHTNSAEARSAHGTEVFILGTDKLDQNLDVAMRENAVIKLESDYKTTYQGFDPNSVESYIMFELMQNRYLDQSLQFASLVQNEFTQSLHRDDRGVRQAAFWVLLKSACPSALIEMGFISNPDEEQYLKSDQGKREIAQALYDAFVNYYKPGTTVDKPVVEKPVVEQPVAEQPVAVQPKVEQPAQPAPSEPSVQSAGPVFRVQIFVSRTQLPASDHNFKGVKDYTFVESNGLYKYMVGNCATRAEANALRDEMKSKFPDCFVVKIENE